ncbi:MAG: cellulase family glycosylhydrolase, partial [Acidobacteriota bacterium]
MSFCFWSSAVAAEYSPVIFPQMVNGELQGQKNRSRVILRNRGPEAISGRIVFQDSEGIPLQIPFNGESLQELPFEVSPGGSVDLMTDGTGSPVVGTARVVTESSRADELAGTLVYELLGHFVSVSQSPVLRLLRLYVSVNEVENTGIALFNPDSTGSAKIGVKLVDEQGEEVAQRILVLPPMQHLSAFVDEEAFFKESLARFPAGFHGGLVLDVLEGKGVAALGLLQQRKSGAVIAVSPEGSGFFDVVGSEIVDPSGRFVHLRGLNLGGWLVPEGYMLHIPGYGSPTAIRTSIEALVGPEKTADFYQAYRSNYVREADLVQLARWGFNSLRVPFHYELFYDRTTHSLREEGFSLLDQLIGWAARSRLWLILDMHCAPGGQNNGNISDSDGRVARLWTEPANQDLTVEIWTEIARRYAAERQIIGYDLLNEPVMPSGYSNAVLKAFYQRLRTAIREVDTNHLLFVEGNWYGTDFSLLTPPFDSKLVYTFHKYWSSTSEDSLRPFLDLRSRYNVPLWVGEFGENSSPWAFEVIEALEKHRIGWAWWPHKKVETISSPYSTPIPIEYQRILDYWNGQAEKPTAAESEAGLSALAERLQEGQSVIHRDVVHALLDPKRGRILRAFKRLSVPGSVAAVDYALGADQVAYFDRRSMRDEYEDSTPWNMGWRYRNDGVDIEESSDPKGNGFNVGWIEEGEWLAFPIEVRESGRYDVEFRVASTGNGGRIRLILDGRAVGTDLLVSNTGGWQNWVTRTLPAIDLVRGEHLLR